MRVVIPNQEKGKEKSKKVKWNNGIFRALVKSKFDYRSINPIITPPSSPLPPDVFTFFWCRTPNRNGNGIICLFEKGKPFFPNACRPCTPTPFLFGMANSQ